jgi:hypothetical protein
VGESVMLRLAGKQLLETSHDLFLLSLRYVVQQMAGGFLYGVFEEEALVTTGSCDMMHLQVVYSPHHHNTVAESTRDSHRRSWPHIIF